MLDRISETTALILGLVAVVIVVLVGWFALVSPQRSKADKLDAQITAVDSELTADQHLLAAPTRRQTQAALRAATRALPDTPRMSEILRQLAALVAQSRIELDSVTPGTVTAVTGAEAQPIAIAVKGRYFALQKFLKLLRQSADARGGKITGSGRLYTVDSIQFSGGDNTGLITASVAMNAFVYATLPTAPTTTTSTDTTASASAGP